MMFAVTISALGKILASVQARTPGAHGGDLGMALQALRTDFPLAKLMARGALLEAIEMGVGSAQISGRKLGLNHRGSETDL